MNYAQELAKAIVDIKAVGFSPQQPITFKTGLISPVYIDNRVFPFHPHAWSLVIAGFEELIKKQGIAVDVLAGIETAGIPHSAALGYAMVKPSVFVRKAVKDHGTKKVVEGGDAAGKQVLLIEDHVTTGSSSLAGVTGLRQAGATVSHCLAITSYNFPESQANFAQAQVTLHTLTDFSAILTVAKDRGLLTQAHIELVEEWMSDPKGWAGRHGYG